MARIRVLVVDDHDFFRKSLEYLLAESSALEVVGSCAGVADAITALEDVCPDVVVMDLEMPGTDGAEGTALLHGRRPDLPVLILTGTAPGWRWQAAMDAGARAVLSKSSPPEQLVQAVVDLGATGPS